MTKKHEKTPLLHTAGAIFFLLVLVAVCLYPRLRRWNAQLHAASVPEGTLRVCFLDVGQGDAILLMGGGQNMLIDGGPGEAAPALMEELEQRGIVHLDYLVVTHPHEDHIGGIPSVLEEVTVDECWMPDDVEDTLSFERTMDALERERVELSVPSPGDTFSFGGTTVTVLAPLTAAEEHNNNSIVLKVVYGNTAFLFTGDMEEQEERELLSSGADLSADVLKVAHHGSGYSNGAAFLDAVGAATAVISCGRDNDYGHPHPALLERLEDRGMQVFRTDQQGTVTVSTDGTRITVSTQQEGEVK